MSADWADVRFSRHQAALRDNNIDLIHIPRLINGAHKNAADIRLAVDAMETLMTHPEVGVFILVAGDSDDTPLVGRLREYGKHIIGVGTQAHASPPSGPGVLGIQVLGDDPRDGGTGRPRRGGRHVRHRRRRAVADPSLSGPRR